MTCPVCESAMEPRFTARVLGRHDVGYHACPSCGLLQTEPPYWLEEAYGSAIADADTGLVQRNIEIAAKLALLLHRWFDARGKFVDVAGGYGMLTRLMRDYGFDFYWSDRYCANLLARGFEAAPGTACEAITAFEVLEHVHDPVAFLREALEAWGTRTIFFTTELYEGAPPTPGAWPYYAFTTGQHVSFYQARTLRRIAERLGLRCRSHGMMHVLTDRAIHPLQFRLATGRLARWALPLVRGRLPTRTQADHDALVRAGPP